MFSYVLELRGLHITRFGRHWRKRSLNIDCITTVLKTSMWLNSVKTVTSAIVANTISVMLSYSFGAIIGLGVHSVYMAWKKRTRRVSNEVLSFSIYVVKTRTGCYGYL